MDVGGSTHRGLDCEQRTPRQTAYGPIVARPGTLESSAAPTEFRTARRARRESSLQAALASILHEAAGSAAHSANSNPHLGPIAILEHA